MSRAIDVNNVSNYSKIFAWGKSLLYIIGYKIAALWQICKFWHSTLSVTLEAGYLCSTGFIEVRVRNIYDQSQTEKAVYEWHNSCGTRVAKLLQMTNISML